MLWKFLGEYEKKPDLPLHKTLSSQHSTHWSVAVGTLSGSILGLLPSTASTQCHTISSAKALQSFVWELNKMWISFPPDGSGTSRCTARHWQRCRWHPPAWWISWRTESWAMRKQQQPLWNTLFALRRTLFPRCTECRTKGEVTGWQGSSWRNTSET